AEDGIRDRTVTGVQTCALPISRRARTPRRVESDESHVRGVDRQLFRKPYRYLGPAARANRGDERRAAVLRRAWRAACAGTNDRRSEERRVGKECRSGGSPSDCK